jgi:hypothetical protein
VDYADRLCHTLKQAEQRFGSRVYPDAIAPITFHDGPPLAGFLPASSTVAICLSRRCESDYLLGCYQLAHETVHLLSPVSRSKTTALEEGVAELFARDYIRENIDLEWPRPIDHRYDDALNLAERFLGPRPDAILHLRRHQPVISSITADLICQAYPAVPMSLALPLVAPFYALSEAAGPHGLA